MTAHHRQRHDRPAVAMSPRRCSTRKNASLVLQCAQTLPMAAGPLATAEGTASHVLRKARYGNKVDYARQLATVRLWTRIDSSSSPRHLKPHLRAAAFGAGYAVKGFGESLWRYERKRGLPAIREFVDLLPSNDAGFFRRFCSFRG